MSSNLTNQGHQRVVVTGMGVNTVIGSDLTTYWRNLIEGNSGISKWRNIDESCCSKVGGDMSGFTVESFLKNTDHGIPEELAEVMQKLLTKTPVAGRITGSASVSAWIDSGLYGDSRVNSERSAHLLAGHNLSFKYIVDNAREYAAEPEYIDPLFAIYAFDTDILAVISEMLNLKGPSMVVGGACASSNLAIMAGLDLIRAGRADVVLVSGGASDFDPLILHAFGMIDALSYKSFNDQPKLASRPFDVRREGFVPSQGSGAVVLESLTHAQSRNARIYAEIKGASSFSDASRLPKPGEDGEIRAMRGALKDAGLTPEMIQYVNAHATSTPMGDATEVSAIKHVLGNVAKKIVVNSTKSIVGHCISSSGLVEAVATILQIKNGVVHPTINLEKSEPELDLDFVPNKSRSYNIDNAISNSFGFGGYNCSIVIGKL